MSGYSHLRLLNWRRGRSLSAAGHLLRALAVLIPCGSLSVPDAGAWTLDEISVIVDLSQQRMFVEVGGEPLGEWRVSTARPGYRTPIGRFRPRRLARVWFSSKYDSAPMPYSVFFLGGYAIHGTYETSKLGRAVSHGCIRLSPANARTLFSLIRQYGAHKTVITIQP